MLRRPDHIERRRQRDRERQQRRAARREAHRIIAQVEVGEAEIGLLVAAEWLTDGDASDRAKVGAAISRLLARMAKSAHA
jgi:hypothetical protein